MDNTSRSAHPLYEDVLRLADRSRLRFLGIFLFHQVGLLTGGTAGLALLLQQVTGIASPAVLRHADLPFLCPGLAQNGLRFTLNAFAAVYRLIHDGSPPPPYLQIGRSNPSMRR